MLHILASWILLDLGVSLVKVILAAIQAGLVFTRLNTSASNQATAVIIPAIYAASVILHILFCLALALVHMGELRKGQLSTAAWRTAGLLVWAVLALTVLTLLAGIITIATNYTGADHPFTNGSKAFNRPFTITFIIFVALCALHIGVLLLYKVRVLSQGPKPKGRIGNDYERVGAEFSHSLRRANRVEDGSFREEGEETGMTERLPITGAQPDVPSATPRRQEHSSAPHGPSISFALPASPTRYHQARRRCDPSSGSGMDSSGDDGLRRQNSSSGYADYEDEDEDVYGDSGAGAHSRFGSAATALSSSAGPVPRPLSHAQYPSFASTGVNGDQDEAPAFPTPMHVQQASHASSSSGLRGPRAPNVGPAPNAPSADMGPPPLPPQTNHRVAPSFDGTTATQQQYLEPDYTGTQLPAYSERHSVNQQTQNSAYQI
ncbi:hypothetical protein OC845_003946 [Tilletia horrida]|nr:hypothetical protein OC845_003946 [Tilletia horrida]